MERQPAAIYPQNSVDDEISLISDPPIATLIKYPKQICQLAIKPRTTKLVIEISQKAYDKNTPAYMFYVFFDWKRQTFELRMGKVDMTQLYEVEANEIPKCIRTNMAFSIAHQDKDILVDFILDLVPCHQIDEIFMVNYVSLPENSMEIDFATLLRNCHLEDDIEATATCNTTAISRELLYYDNTSYSPMIAPQETIGKLLQYISKLIPSF